MRVDHESPPAPADWIEKTKDGEDDLQAAINRFSPRSTDLAGFRRGTKKRSPQSVRKHSSPSKVITAESKVVCGARSFVSGTRIGIKAMYELGLGAEFLAASFQKDAAD